MMKEIISPEQAAIDALFNEPAPRTGKLVRVSEEQIKILKTLSPDEQGTMIRLIYQEGNDERPINP